jgi:hypothetical protein
VIVADRSAGVVAMRVNPIHVSSLPFTSSRMKSRLPARRERVAAARRMSGKFHELASDSAAEDATIVGVLDRILGATVFAGGSTVVVLWNGAALTLGHALVITAGVGALGGLLWRRRQRQRRTS